jgi:MFS family permease
VPTVGRTLNRNFFLLWQGQLVSLMGTQVFRLGMVVWLTQAADSATLLGLLMATFIVPGLLIGPFGGVLVDRYSRRLVLTVCELVQGVAVLALGLLWLAAPASRPIGIGGLFVLAFIIGSATAVLQPATIAIVPELVPRERLPRANSIVQGSFQIGALLAQVLSGVSFRLIGAPLLALFDAATYFYSAASTFLIRTPAPPRSAAVPTTMRPAFGRDLRAALTYVRATPGLLALMLLTAGLKFFVAPFTVLFAFYVQGHLHASADWYGFLIGGMGLGAIVGVVISGAVTLDPRSSGIAIVAAFIVQSLALTALAVVATPPAALALVTLSGVLNGFLGVRLTTLLQLAIAADMRGRVFAVLRTLTEGLVPVATILAGIVADLTGRNVPAVYAACGVALTCLSFGLAASRACRAFLTGAAAPARAVRPGAPPDARVAAGVGG